MKPQITIIMPVYNGEKYIQKSITTVNNHLHEYTHIRDKIVAFYDIRC